jgi:hypothetical protein
MQHLGSKDDVPEKPIPHGLAPNPYMRRVLRLISLATDSGFLLALGSIWSSFLDHDYNLKPSLPYTLNLSTFL